MQAESKIQEAKFFLDAIRDCYNPIMYPDVVFYFNAFLGSAISILEYLRHDYANEFDFKIGIDDRNFKSKFNEQAQKSPDKNIRKFQQWITDKNVQIKKVDEIGKLLTIKRNRITHRRFEPLSVRIRYRYEVMTDQSHSKIKELIVPFSINQPTNLEKEKLSQISTNLIDKKMVLQIDDNKTIDMEEACQTFLDKVKKIVDEAQKQFPLSSKLNK